MKNYFKFSKSQKIGVITVSVFLLIQIIYLNIQGSLPMSDPFNVNPNDYKLIENNSSKQIKNTQQKDKQVYSNFNPNNLSLTQWINLGFSEKQAKSILKFKNTIKGFKNKTDLKKVFVISEKKYKELEPYIKIENKKTSNNINSKTKITNKPHNKPKLVIVCEINTATKEDLLKIVGVGEFTAKQILKHKNKIGGFHSVNQLKEVFGIKENNFELIKQQVTVNKTKINKILVNEWSIPKLKAHPYISWDIALAITDKRLIGKLNNLQFLVDDKQLLTQKELDNLKPYIKY